MLPHSCNCSQTIYLRKLTPNPSRTTSLGTDVLGRVVRRVKWEEEGRSQTGVTDPVCMPEGHDKIQGKLGGMEMWEHMMWFVFAPERPSSSPHGRACVRLCLGKQIESRLSSDGMTTWFLVTQPAKQPGEAAPHKHLNQIPLKYFAAKSAENVRLRAAPVYIQSQTKLRISAAAIQLPCFWLSSLSVSHCCKSTPLLFFCETPCVDG